ncbi:ribosomal protein L1p/L10e family-domain-containing protein [Delphinella strobiligena]|nr:ribosomal protein L1p/L10e family-domain-containing protein [Delphinella strobiligena]
MAPVSTAVAVSSSPYQLDKKQLQRNTRALVKKIQSGEISKKNESGKQDLLGDDENVQDIRLEIATKKHMCKEKSLKPRKIFVPNPIRDVNNEELSVVLITADPAEKYNSIIKDDRFPASLRERLSNPHVIGVKSLEKHYGKSFERRRQLANDYQVFLADDRIIARLAKILGSDFYGATKTRPIPINLQGARQNDKDEQGNKRQKLAEGGTKLVRADIDPESAAKTIARAIGATTFPVNASTNASIVVGNSAMDPEKLAENIEFVVNEVVERFVTKGWRGIKALDVKGTHTATLPLWKTSELWEDDEDVLDHEPIKAIKESKGDKKKRKRSALSEATELKDDKETTEQPSESKKRKSLDAAPVPVDELELKKKAKTEAAEAKKAKKAQKEELMKKSKAAVAA